MQASAVALTALGAGRYGMGEIGISPGSVTVSGTGGSCPSLSVTPGSFRLGYKLGATLTEDSIHLPNKGTCTSFTTAYSYTNCSFDVAEVDAYRCRMAIDPDANPATVELGYCKLFMDV